MSQPIPVGIIGLASNGTGWAVNAHLPYLKDSSKYKIVALANSTKNAAVESIKTNKLDPNTKAYGTPEDLAADPDVKLIIDAVRVDRHYATVKPGLEAGKDLFVEWPIASTTAQAKEIVQLAKQKGAKVVVGLQALNAPVLQKLKEILDSGRIGKVLSVDIVAYGFPSTAPGRQSKNLAYLFEEAVGRPWYSIFAGHGLSGITHVLGDLTNIQSNLGQIHPTRKIVDADGKPAGELKSDVADLVQVYGTFGNGARLTYSLRSDGPFKGTPGLDWRVLGQEGSIRFTSSLAAFQAFPSEIKVQVHDFKTDKVEDVAVGDILPQLPTTARHTAALYEAFADGRKDGYVNGEQAVKLHELLDKIYEGFKPASS